MAAPRWVAYVDKSVRNRVSKFSVPLGAGLGGGRPSQPQIRRGGPGNSVGHIIVVTQQL